MWNCREESLFTSLLQWAELDMEMPSIMLRPYFAFTANVSGSISWTYG